MATLTQDTPPSSAASQADNSYATSQAVQYIRNLQASLQRTNSRLDKVQASYTLAASRQSNTNTEFQEATSEEAQARTNLAEAMDARTKLETVTDFFKTRQMVTTEMIGYAKQMAQSMFDAMQYLGREGVQRVEDIMTAVDDFNKKTDNTASQWTPLFIDKVRAASSKGSVALKAAYTAVNAAFEAYVSNLKINYRAQQYFLQFRNLSAELSKIIDRLSREHTLARTKLTVLTGQKLAVDRQVEQLSDSLQDLQFEAAQLQAEYTAAQQGASYSIATASQGT